MKQIGRDKEDLEVYFDRKKLVSSYQTNIGDQEPFIKLCLFLLIMTDRVDA